MINFDKDKKSIIEQIQNNTFASQEIRDWLVKDAHIGLIKSLCKEINKQSTRGQFREVIENYRASLHGNAIKPDVEEIYSCIRQALNNFQLVDSSTIRASRGRAGGLYTEGGGKKVVRPVVAKKKMEKDQQDAEEQLEQTDITEAKVEKEYYPLVQEWAIKNGYPSCKVTGGKLPGFKWENPDLIDIQYTVGEFTRAIDFGITTFEVKLRVVPEAIWQAAHYKKFSREVYVVFSKTEEEVREQDDRRVFPLAVELGIGVLALDQNRNEFKLIHSPTQFNPATSEIDLVADRFKELFKETLKAAGDELRVKIGFKII
ncbi:MAG: hypothetical protein HOO95_04190 [Gallionella sp.]|nr:hypothetical protein [Gallionella sp.]